MCSGYHQLYMTRYGNSSLFVGARAHCALDPYNCHNYHPHRQVEVISYDWLPRLTFLTAWRVDFNLSVASFEPLIQGVRGLVDLALASPLPTPPRLVFASSISVFGGPSTIKTVSADFVTDNTSRTDWHSSTPAPEAPIEDPKIAVGNGYGESKWVSEMILDRAARQTPLRPVAVRIGQLSGGENGSWNIAEWVPSVVRSGEVVKALPASDEVCTTSFSSER